MYYAKFNYWNGMRCRLYEVVEGSDTNGAQSISDSNVDGRDAYNWQR